MLSALRSSPAIEVRNMLAGGCWTCIARVIVADRAVDFAIELCSGHLVVVRCAEELSAEDYAALTTMVSEGDFVWAGIVFSEKPQRVWPEGIEAFHLSELPLLIERLQELQRAAAP